jgi:hypothetical protein
MASTGAVAVRTVDGPAPTIWMEITYSASLQQFQERLDAVLDRLVGI